MCVFQLKNQKKTWSSSCEKPPQNGYLGVVKRFLPSADDQKMSSFSIRGLETTSHCFPETFRGLCQREFLVPPP